MDIGPPFLPVPLFDHITYAGLLPRTGFPASLGAITALAAARPIIGIIIETSF
jgi:hypothetical protein